MVGLVLDGGSAFAQRRSQQNASDLAAMAGANTYLLTNDETTARNAARAVTAENGWTNAASGVTVNVAFDYTNGVEVTVTVDAPHHNNFGSIIGLETMDVATTATALSGFPDTASGAGADDLQHRRLRVAEREAEGGVRKQELAVRIRRDQR